MSPEIESHGFELTEKVFSEQAVPVISGEKGGVKPRELRSPNRDGSQPYLLTGQPDLEALRGSQQAREVRGRIHHQPDLPLRSCQVHHREAVHRLQINLRLERLVARRPADKNKPTRTTATWDAVLGIRPGFVHFAVRATFPTSHGEGKRALD